MTHVGVKGGRKITLKLKIRQKDAPPAHKYLGHGHCYNLSKSCDVPGGTAAKNWQVISQLSFDMFEELSIPKEEVRGMGITLSKLDTTLPKDHKESQSMRSWLATGIASEKLTSRGIPSPVLGHSVTGTGPANLHVPGKSETSTNNTDLDFDLPPMSQLHLSQVECLPSPLKNSILATVEARNTKVSRSSVLLNTADPSCSKAFPRRRQNNSRALTGRSISPKPKSSSVRRSRIFGNGESTLGQTEKPVSPAVAISTSVVDRVAFFDKDIYPLTSFLDANPEADDEATKQVATFFVRCTGERLLTDVVILLRCVKSRKDRWGLVAYDSLLAVVNEAMEREKGVRLDAACI